MSTNLTVKHQIAAAYVAEFTHSATDSQITQTLLNFNSKQKIKIGFLSYDFNDHPTSHLIEGIFNIISTQKSTNNNQINSLFHNFETYIYNYGLNDNSSYRQQLELLSDVFVDMNTMSYQESYNLIKEDNIHVLFDMQVHTFGNRIQIFVKQPAPIQVSDYF